MTGHEIAENLRNSSEQWTTGHLFEVIEGKPAYCVLGLKAHEAGVSDEQLIKVQKLGLLGSALGEGDAELLSNVWQENDRSFSKEQLITVFDSPRYRDVNFPIEAWIERIKAA